MSGAPAISVIMAAFNGAALLPATLATLQKQTFGDFEVIVVDDCSTDATRDVLRAWPDPRVRMIALDANGGPVRARNRAFAEARGRYIAALDQDDLCLPDRFARQVAYLDAHPATVLVASATEVLDGARLLPSPHVAHTTPTLLRWLIRIENPIVWSSVMIRADAGRRLDPFTRPDILYAEDFDLYHRLSALGAIARIDTPLLAYRRHAAGASQRYEDVMLGSARRVLSAAYETVLGAEAEPAATLIVEHLMHRQPVPDRTALARLGDHLVRLQNGFLAEQPWSTSDMRMVRWTTARRWADVSRASLRAGTLTLSEALTVRPPHLGLGHAGMEELLWARLIGRARGLGRRHTLAA
jgi:GT2 family glycosyltransferase